MEEQLSTEEPMKLGIKYIRGNCAQVNLAFAFDCQARLHVSKYYSTGYRNMVFGIPKNLILAIACYAVTRILANMQMMIISTLASSLDFMHNNTLLNHFKLEPTNSRISLMQSITAISSFIGIIFSIWKITSILEKKGRKYVCSNLRFYFSFVISILQLSAAIFQASEFYIISMILLGAMSPIQLYFVNIYLGESAPDKHRGFTATVLPIFDIIATVIMNLLTPPNILGAPHKWFVFPVAMIIITSAIYLFTMRLPDSPKWLVQENRLDEAREAIIFYHGEDCNEESVIYSMIRERNLIKEKQLSLKEIWIDDTLREGLKLIISVGFFLAFNPILTEITYTIMIHSNVGFTVNETLNLSLYLSVFFYPARFIGTYFIEKAGRRAILIFGHFALMTKIILSITSQWIAFVSGPNTATKLLFTLGDCFSQMFVVSGITSLAVLLTLELLPGPARATSMQLVQIIGIFAILPFDAMYPFINSIFPAAFYFPFLIVANCVFLYLYRNLPETSGRAVIDIIESMDDEVTSRHSTLYSERMPLIRKRSRTLQQNRVQYLPNIARERAFSCDYKKALII